MKINSSSSNTSWRSVTLEDLVEQHSGQWGQESPVPDAKEMLVLGVGNVTNEGQLDLEGATQRFFTTREYDAIAKEGDLLVVKSSGSATNIRSGKTAICPPELSGRVACSNFMYRLAVKRDLAEPYLLWLILNSPMAKDFVRSVIGASTYPNIKWETYKAFRFSLPPPDEQKRMAARLREQMAEVERARAAVQAQLDAAQTLPAALLRAIFTSPAAQRWPRRRLGDVCQMLPARSVASDGDTEVRAITSACLTETGFSSAGIKIARMDGDDANESKLTLGEILIARSNTPELVGRVAMFEGPADGVVASDLTIRLRPADERTGRFFNRYLSFLYLTGYWRERASGASGTMKKITRTQLDALEVPFPPLAEQQKIATRLDAELTAARSLRQSLETRLAEIERLSVALLREAFSGKV